MDINMDEIPANTEADATTDQLTSLIAIDVPISPTAVCAIVFMALIPAAFNHFNSFFFIFIFLSCFFQAIEKAAYAANSNNNSL